MNKNWDMEQAWRSGQFWLDIMTRMAAAGTNAAVHGTAPPEAGRQVRGAMFETMTHQTEEFLRSPQFLESMKQSMTASLEFQKRWQEFFTSVRHQTQGVAMQDIDATMLVVQRVEGRVLDGLEQITTQLAEINRRLDRLEAAGEHRPRGSRTNGEAAAAAGAAAGQSSQERPTRRESGGGGGGGGGGAHKSKE